MSRADGPVLLLGIGNLLMRDEGVGIQVVRALEDPGFGLPPGTRVVDGGTLGLDLLPLIDDARAVVLVDAVDIGAAPGTVAVLRGMEIGGALGGHISPHQVGIGDLLAVARLTGVLPERVALVGVQPATVEIGLDLSPTVGAVLPLAAEAARRELWAVTVPGGA